MSATKLAATVAAAVVVTSSVVAIFVHRKNKRRRRSAVEFNVPSEILSNKYCPYQQEVVLAVQLALTAGSNMTQHYNSKGTGDENITNLDISTKTNASDLATIIDVQNENYITCAIQDYYPTHYIIGEEASSDAGHIAPLHREGYTWIIDPIDGTTNFAAGLPLHCVSIGLCHHGIPVMGVVYSPPTEEMYIGIRNCGAYRNGIRLLGCSGDKASKTLSNAVVCFELGYFSETGDRVDIMMNAIKRLLEHGVRATRQLGSGVLDLCYVASGRMDVVYTGLSDEGWKPWDYCAGLVIALEAGCEMTHLEAKCNDDVIDGSLRRGYDFNLYSKSMICGVNRTLVEDTRRVVLGRT
jgi:myo-inositol-1(or 4)-monophosphatase